MTDKSQPDRQDGDAPRCNRCPPSSIIDDDRCLDCPRRVIAATPYLSAPPQPAPDAPGHTDLMVSPESIDSFMHRNPLPVPDAPQEALDREEQVLLAEYHSGRLNGNRVIKAVFERLRALFTPVLPDVTGDTKKKYKCPHCGEISDTVHDGACGVW